MNRSSSPIDLPDYRSSSYRGRFAPSPTGSLHAGSLVAALASWLDARAHHGTWLIRMEDLDPPREVDGAAGEILEDLARFGLVSDEPVLFQSQRSAIYQTAFDRLLHQNRIFGCICSRRDIRLASHAAGLQDTAYPGTCRDGTPNGTPVRSWRFRVEPGTVRIVDRALGVIEQDIEHTVGDFVVRRADGAWAYQLAVVVDDAEQRITDIVRGIDLLDNTPRQAMLQKALGLPTPRYLHVPVVLAADGQKLSKQTGARRLDGSRPLEELERAGAHLGLPRVGASRVDAFLDVAARAWPERIAERT